MVGGAPLEQTSRLLRCGGRITGTQNGLAIAGDFMSATTVLSLVALYMTSGWDTAIYFIAPLAELALMLLLIAGPLRRLGRFTLGDVMTSRLDDDRLRIFSGVSTLVVSLFYLVAQMVGAGTLISLLFGPSFVESVIIIGVLMAIYVAVGGMLAATWVQIIKAVILLGSVMILTALTLFKAAGLQALYAKGAELSVTGPLLFQPGGFQANAFSNLSLGFGMALGILDMPHLLIRFFTVPDVKQARHSVVVASAIIAMVFAMIFLVVGIGGVVFVSGNPAFTNNAGEIVGGNNMIALHLATALGGELLFGLVAAVAFSTILAVVAGLTIASSTAVSYDLYRLFRRRKSSEREELWAFRLGAVALAVVGIILSISFQNENIAFLSALAFTVSASTNFPLLFLVLYWPRLTAIGALAGGIAGFLTSIGLIILSPTVWVKALGHDTAIFPADYPTLLTMPLAFIVCIVVSMMTEKVNTVHERQAEPQQA